MNPAPLVLPNRALTWLEQCRRHHDFKCLETTLRPGGEWIWQRGRLEHRTGGYFAVTGIRSTDGVFAAEPRSQPIILQPEIGVLGFVMQGDARDDRKVLVQAKAEPGNIGGVQLAPTVQATESNYRRLHQGRPTRFLSLFVEQTERDLIADSLQSENGWRFWGKYNRNAVCLVPGSIEGDTHQDWNWLPLDDLLAALDSDFTVNTDARSVLVSSDWGNLVGGAPFRDRDDAEAAELARSYESRMGIRHGLPHALIEQLQGVRVRQAFRVEEVPLTELSDWEADAGGVRSRRGGGLSVKIYDVEIPAREVPRWAQPLMTDSAEGLCVLFGQMLEGIWRFLLRASVEIGFHEHAQWGPTLFAPELPEDQVMADLREIHADSSRCRPLVVCRQSDEGGRFYHSLCRYEIVTVAAEVEMPVSPELAWATLGEIQALAKIQGMLTNELRSTLSLLFTRL